MDEFEAIKSAQAPASARHHPEDDSSGEYSDSETPHLNNDTETQQEIPGSGPADMHLFKHSSHLSGSYQTGVKGVIADACSYEKAKRREINANKAPSTYSGYVAPRDQQERNRDHSSDVESGDEDFVRTWRKNRMQELKTGVSSTRRQSPSKRKYGRVEPVDASGYLDAVERVSPETIVVVTIYNEESSECRFVEDCLNTLARRYITTHFIKLHHQEAEMDPAVVPAVLAYKGGELFATVMRIVDEIPPSRSLSTDSLELVLRRENILHKD